MKQINEVTHDNFEAQVFDNEDGTWRLHWHDYVINEWNEDYASLPLALVRLAGLVEGVTRERFFIDARPDAFAHKAQVFLHTEVLAP